MNKQEQLSLKCKKCGSNDLRIEPKIVIRSRGGGCLSSIVWLIFSTLGMGILGVILFFWAVSILNLFRTPLLIIITLTAWISAVKIVNGKPVGVAICQNCGKQLDVNANGTPFSNPVANSIKLVISFALLIFFGYIAYRVGSWLESYQDNLTLIV